MYAIDKNQSMSNQVNYMNELEGNSSNSTARN